MIMKINRKMASLFVSIVFFSNQKTAFNPCLNYPSSKLKNDFTLGKVHSINGNSIEFKKFNNHWILTVKSNRKKNPEMRR